MRTERHSHRDTPERLLNAAEHLFAKYGFDGVGMRALANAAKVNLNAATYHFKTKERLYIETFLRRFRLITEARLQMLQQAKKEAKGGTVPVAVTLECLIRPALMIAQESPAFPALLARNLFMPPSFMRRVIEREVMPGLDPFVAVLAEALPTLPRELLHMRVSFAGGTLLMLASRLSQVPRKRGWQEVFVQAATRELVGFLAAGLQSPIHCPLEGGFAPSSLPFPLAITRP